MPSPRTAEAFAPAKVNLTLHVTGQRADGYHLLDSLVVFADLGDTVVVTAADATSLRVVGPMAGAVPVGEDNLVLRAAALLPDVRAEITLTKTLPAAAGLGGGSSDAAACLHALSAVSGRTLPGPEALLALGADVPACAAGVPVRMRGIGERIDPVPPLPPLWLVLVNPGVALSTPAVFRALARRDNPPMAPMPVGADQGLLLDWLRAQRNDLEAAACALAPEVGAALATLSAGSGCALARMSGSGATCFGVFTDPVAAARTAGRIARAQPDWWVRAAPVRR